MSWTIIVLLSLGSYAFKAAGFLALGGRDVPAPVVRFVTLLPAALLMALIVSQTLGGADGGIVADARLAGLGVAALAVWRRAPFLVVVTAGAATAALLRALAG